MGNSVSLFLTVDVVSDVFFEITKVGVEIKIGGVTFDQRINKFKISWLASFYEGKWRGLGITGNDGVTKKTGCKTGDVDGYKRISFEKRHWVHCAKYMNIIQEDICWKIEK